MIVDKIKCPYCGYVMPLKVDPDAKCKGVWIKCKGRNCKKEFEIKIGKVKQCHHVPMTFTCEVISLAEGRVEYEVRADTSKVKKDLDDAEKK